MQIGKETHLCTRENLFEDLELQSQFLKPGIKSFKIKQQKKSFTANTLIELFYYFNPVAG